MDTTSAPANSDEWILRLVSTAGKRLFWRLNGPLEHAISVAASEFCEPDAVPEHLPMEPYYLGPSSPDPDAAPTWHALSHESLLQPPASSVTVRIRCIDAWEQIWAEQHRECYDAVFAMERRRLGPRPGDETLDAPIFVLECCGEKRPWSRDTQLEVVAAGAFVTIHEYVEAVHPWLMGMRDTLLHVLGKVDFKPPWPADTKLAVLYLGPGPLRIDREDRWAWWHKRPPVGGSAVGDPGGGQERSHKVIERAKARAKAMVLARQEALRQQEASGQQEESA